MIEKLQPWVFGHNPAFDDKESLTAIQQTAKIYEKVNELIESYNGFGEDLRKDFEKFKTDSNTNYSEFISSVENKFNSFKNNIDLKISEQDTNINNSLSEYERKVNETLLYFKTNLQNSIKNEIEKMKNSGELDTAIYQAFDNINIALENYKSELNSKFANFINNNTKWQNDTKADLQETERAFESRVDNNLNVVNARMDTFTAGNNAGTENNSELLDIRVGFDGKEYTTAGTAVRQQVKRLYEIEFDKYLIAFDTVGQIMFAIPDPVMLDLDQMITCFKRYNNLRDDLIIPHFNENCRALLIPKTVKTINTSTIFLNFQNLKYIIFEGDPTSYSNDDWRVELAQLNPSTSKIFLYDQDFKTSRFANVVQMIVPLDNEIKNHTTAINTIQNNTTEIVEENSNKFLTSGGAYNALSNKVNFKNTYYELGGTGGLNTACDPDTIYNVCFNAPCNNVAQGTKGILFATDENTQILITDRGNIYYRYYNETDDIWSEFTSAISQKVNSVNGVFPDNLGNVDLLVKCGYGTDLADCTDKSKIYYFHSGIIGLRGSTADFGGAGMYIGFIKKINSGWLFISTGEGNKKSNYRISENGKINLIGSSYDYNDLSNKPAINNVELTGNKTLADLGLYSKAEVDEIIANQSVSGSGTLGINSTSHSADVISSATYYYVKQGNLVTLFCSIKFNAGDCNFAGFNRLPFSYNNKLGQLRIVSTTSKSEMFRIAVSSGMLFIASSTIARTQDEELNFSITYLT